MHKIVNNERRITKKDFKKTKNEKLLEYMQEKEGRGLLSSIIPLASKLASKVLPAVGLSSIMGLTKGLSKKIFGGNFGNDSELRVYVVSHDKIPKLVEKGEHLLNDRQKRYIQEALQTGKDVAIRPMKSQIGDFLPLILSTIGGVLLNKLLGGGMTFPQVVGKGLQFPTSQGKGMQFIPNPYLVSYQMPQFYGNGYGKKKDMGRDCSQERIPH